MAFKKELVSESVAWFVRVCILVFYFLISLFFFPFLLWCYSSVVV